MDAGDECMEAERLLLADLHKREVSAFIRLYKAYSEDLLIFIYVQLQDRGLATRMLVDFFEDLWEGADFSSMHPPIYPLLLDLVKSRIVIFRGAGD